jgi:hypothetical protein
VTAMSVNEWPEPTIVTLSPRSRAATTAAATASLSSGATVWTGSARARPHPFSQLCRDAEYGARRDTTGRVTVAAAYSTA